jgi:type IV secretion system protein VirB8
MPLTASFLLAPETLKPGEEKDNPIGPRIPGATQ